MSIARRTVLALACLAAAWASGIDAARPARLLADFPTGSIIVATSRHNCLHFTAWFAETPSQRSRGLMFVEALDDFEAMLFRFGAEAPVSMWMKNTLIPLDMVFADAAGRFVRIAERTEPLSTRSITSGRPASLVIELPGGFAERWGLDGDSRLLLAERLR